ncbi:Indole-3-glycerol-phosphate synthase [Denitrovibrio acetiphilus DSM 12809]|uniref:indole-3-glycerol-phosphate synthase n=1 Tax=Denitrovibrio acetiphilus (strain DSM 12809 / NBRC 114555 / N2460) TaxID=522772 RepID=D4H7E8_DENA2|nr:indole-3-glycerol phosphate synthase TrpC [Denitrovibrio acetiphilus]ADD67947.1 Indole-3-glycerol-phosphate synthase [Denitrovibrio acetiphilus DSM 12809]
MKCSDVLERILSNKRKEIELLSESVEERTKPLLDFRQAIIDRQFICEVKKASPSLGAINTGADVEKVAAVYESIGAGCVSVLTDKEFFGGSFDDLRKVTAKVSIPVLCKDFIITEKQIDVAYSMGADAVLLMATSLSREDYERLYSYVKGKGMQALVEIHELEELEIVKGMEPDILGVNSRNLKTLEIDLNKGAEIIRSLPEYEVKIAESGMKAEADIRLMSQAGAKGFLVGSSLMGADDPAGVFASLRSGLCS